MFNFCFIITTSWRIVKNFIKKIFITSELNFNFWDTITSYTKRLSQEDQPSDNNSMKESNLVIQLRLRKKQENFKIPFINSKGLIFN